jgi:hypothetical protein
MSDELRDFGNGATRSKDADGERYDLISPFALQRVAKIMSEGALTHGPSNWRLGIPIDMTLNHLERHLQLWKMERWTGEKIGPDDHISKVIWGAMAIAHYIDAGPVDYGTMIPVADLKNHPDVVAKKKEKVAKKKWSAPPPPPPTPNTSEERENFLLDRIRAICGSGDEISDPNGPPKP